MIYVKYISKRFFKVVSLCAIEQIFVGRTFCTIISDVIVNLYAIRCGKEGE